MTGWLIVIAGSLTLAGIYAIITMVLNFEAAWAGLWDLGLAGLLAVGGYTFVILTQGDADAGVAFAPGLPIWIGIIAASLVTGLVALLIGLPSLRLRGEFFLITTFAFAEVIRQFAINQAWLTRGTVGFIQLGRPMESLVSAQSYNFLLLVIVAAVVVLLYLLMSRLGNSPYGRASRALRDNEPVAMSLGKSITGHRLATFVFAGLILGAVAPLYVWYIRSIFPNLFASPITFTAWTALVVGGIGSFRGPLVGALLLVGLTEALLYVPVAADHATLLASSQPFLIGVALIAVLRLRPSGIVSERSAFAGSEARFRKAVSGVSVGSGPPTGLVASKERV